MEQLPGHSGSRSGARVLRTDWILEQFGKSRFERSSSTGSSLGTEWRLGRGTISRGRSIWGVKRFVEKHASGKKDIKEVPRAPLRAARPSLEQIFGRRGEKAIGEAYEQGYRLNEIAAHLGIHYATVSRRLKRIEQTS